MQISFLHVLMYMFLKQEKPEIEDFDRRKKDFGSKEKYLEKFKYLRKYCKKCPQKFNG